MKRLWLACFIVAAGWLATLGILTVFVKTEARPRPRPSSERWVATGPLDVLNVGGWLLMVGLPAAIVVVSTAYYLRRQYFAKPSY